MTKKKAITKKEAPPKPSVLLLRLEKLYKGGKRWIKHQAKVPPGGIHWIGKRQVRYPHGAFCLIGGVQEINTARQGEVESYLNHAVKFRNDIIGSNDDKNTRFRDVLGWIRKARKLALADGN